MRKRASKIEVEKQAGFVKELMDRLVGDIKNSQESSFAFAEYQPTIIQADVTRIRRELNVLSKMTMEGWEQ